MYDAMDLKCPKRTRIWFYAIIHLGFPNRLTYGDTHTGFYSRFILFQIIAPMQSQMD